MAKSTCLTKGDTRWATEWATASSTRGWERRILNDKRCCEMTIGGNKCIHISEDLKISYLSGSHKSIPFFYLLSYITKMAAKIQMDVSNRAIISNCFLKMTVARLFWWITLIHWSRSNKQHCSKLETQFWNKIVSMIARHLAFAE